MDDHLMESLHGIYHNNWANVLPKLGHATGAPPARLKLFGNSSM